MSSVILPSVGNFLGGAIGGPIGSTIGYGLGSHLGQELDKELFKKKLPYSSGARLTDVTLQTATYGKMIPIVYGTAKLAGNIIWASKIREHREDHFQRRSKFGSKSLVGTEYNYTISLAIAICEGEINEILRVWADDRLIDPKTASYRFYNGSEDQIPDPLIEAHQGFKRTPAFRGIAYIVIENLPLSNYGRSIPNFLFEVKRKIKIHSLTNESPLEEKIKAMVMIPGSGEFVYDTVVQSKIPKNYNPKYGNFNFQRTKINQNNRENQADSLVALKQLSDTCPNLEWIAPVVGWFTNSTNARECRVLPGVEYKSSQTLPDQWHVAGFNRESAHLITQNKFHSPIYGGTSNDLAILRYLDAMKSYNYKIMFYPMVFVDKEDKPWRGRISGSPEDIKNFFEGPEGYNRFILHYANLVKDKVDAFIIGSELIGLTKVRDKNNKFIAVDCLIELAKKVKEIMGEKVKITYAADWSEYHHTDYGWYNLDPLWACDSIDFIGIDAYFPLTNATKNFYDEERIIEGWQSGEGYDFYYADEKKTDKQPLGADYAWKNIKHWWESEHTNPDGVKTIWKPKSKKIWFTEIGFPSIDLASNQPNVFYSPDSMEGNVPIHSKGVVDFVAQRQALNATEKYWRNNEFLEQMFIWCWDARPFPYWPDLKTIWADGGCWARGHWVNGKLGLTTLNAIIQELALRCGLDLNKVRAEQLTDFVDGLVLSHQQSALEIIDLLKTAYFFDTCEVDDKIHFVKRATSRAYHISREELVIHNEQPEITIKKLCSSNLSRIVALHYFNYVFDYQLSVEFSHNFCCPTNQISNIHLPIIIEPQKAKAIAEISLQEAWQGQFIYDFILPPKYLSVKPNDIIYLKNNDKDLSMRVVSTSLEGGRVNRVRAISIKADIYNQQMKVSNNKEGILINKDLFDPGPTEILAFKLPKLPYDVFDTNIHIGVIGGDKDWRGAEIICPDNSILYFWGAATYGMVEKFNNDSILVEIFNGELSSKTESELGRYANLCVIGSEIIQFANAEILERNKYKLSGLKRNMFGTSRDASQRFIALDNNIQKFPLNNDQLGKSQEFIATSIGHDIDKSKKFNFVF